MIKLKNLLKEDFIGNYENMHEVFINPKSIKRMASDLRGYSHPNGDLFVIDDGYSVIHSELAKWLSHNGFPTPDDETNSGLVKNIKKGYITWQRVGNTNTFKLGESINFYDERYFKESELMPFIEKYAKKVRQKNLQYKFVLEPNRD